jgi:hypothetical protein
MRGFYSTVSYDQTKLRTDNPICLEVYRIHSNKKTWFYLEHPQVKT